jgi:DNA-binding NarL/FixJ family response regulator
LRLNAEHKPDIIITDISLKKSDGIDLIKRIKARDENARILVWSMHSENTYADRALRAGAMGYITKEQATEKIIDAIRQVLAGKFYLSPAMREKLLRRATNGELKQETSPMDNLTDRELEVFRMIGAGVKTQDIADQLHLSVKTIETHRDRIKKKLDLKDATELLRCAVLWVTENA